MTNVTLREGGWSLHSKCHLWKKIQDMDNNESFLDPLKMGVRSKFWPQKRGIFPTQNVMKNFKNLKVEFCWSSFDSRWQMSYINKTRGLQLGQMKNVLINISKPVIPTIDKTKQWDESMRRCPLILKNISWKQRDIFRLLFLSEEMNQLTDSKTINSNSFQPIFEMSSHGDLH